MIIWVTKLPIAIFWLMRFCSLLNYKPIFLITFVLLSLYIKIYCCVLFVSMFRAIWMEWNYLLGLEVKNVSINTWLWKKQKKVYPLFNHKTTQSKIVFPILSCRLVWIMNSIKVVLVGVNSFILPCLWSWEMEIVWAFTLLLPANAFSFIIKEYV